MSINQFDDNMKNSIFNRESKAELLQIKNEILTGVRESQKLSDNKLNVFRETTENKLTKFEEKLNKLLEKLEETKDDKPMNNINNDHINDLLKFESETRDKLITINIKIDNLEKDMHNNVYRIDKILAESVIYPGIIGNMCKFKTFHDFINYILTQTSQNTTFRDKTELDLKTFKARIDKHLKSFSAQLDNTLNEANIFTRKTIEDVELKMKTLSLNLDEKIQNVRIDNSKLDKSLENLRNEFKKNNEIKEENDKIFEEKISELQEENNNANENFLEHKNEFNLMKEQIDQLFSLIEDIKPGSNKERIKNVDLNDDNSNKNTPKIRKRIKYESKIKKYIHGEINADEIGAINPIITNSNKILNKNLNNYNLKGVKRFNINNNSNINDDKENYQDNPESYNTKSKNYNQINKYKLNKDYTNNRHDNSEGKNNNYYTDSEDDNTNSKRNKSKSNSNKNDLSIKKETYNSIKNKNIPRTTKTEKVKNSRREINLRNIKNKQITYNEKPKNRNPKEKNKNLKNKKKILKNVQKKTKEEYESEENDEEEDEEIEENNEKFNEEEEESFDNVGDNLSCDDIVDYSDVDEDSDKEKSEHKNNKKLKGRTSKLKLPKIKENKRGTSAKNSKLKKILQLSNNNYKSNLREKENKIKYINSKSRNNNIKNVELKNNKSHQDIFSKKPNIDQKHGKTSDTRKIIIFKNNKNEHTNTMKDNFNKKYPSDYTKIIKEENI